MGNDVPARPDCSQRDNQHLLQRFRAALRAAHASPGEQTVEELRAAAAPLMEQLRAEYLAAGGEDGDDAAVLHWLRILLLRRDNDGMPDSPTWLLSNWREDEAG